MKSLETAQLDIYCETTFKVTEFSKLLEEIHWLDSKYHTYYGDIKLVISSFINFWINTMDEVIMLADKYSHNSTKKTLLQLIDDTLNSQKSIQNSIMDELLSVTSETEKSELVLLEQEYDKYVEKLNGIRIFVESVDKQENIDLFAKKHFKELISDKQQSFELAQQYLALMLADRVDNIRASIVERLQRMVNNLRSLEDRSDEALDSLHLQLYDKNKESLMLSRQHNKCSVENANIFREIEIVHGKIAHCSNDIPISMVKKEVQYWKIRLIEIDVIYNILQKITKELEYLEGQEKLYKSLECTELPGSKLQHFENIGKNFIQRKQYLEDIKIKNAKALISYMSVRGPNQSFSENKEGSYYIDEFGHQVYNSKFGLNTYHKDCSGNLIEIADFYKYSYDAKGLHTLDARGEKNYQIAPCCSSYILSEDYLRAKVTKDCGHSEKANQSCSLQPKNPHSATILPVVTTIDLKKVLTREETQYLWRNVGSVLQQALKDVSEAQPKNPIHYLAHKLLFHRHNMTFEEFKSLRQQSEDHRIVVLRDRKERDKIASKSWKRKQVSHRKPEESDDTLERQALDSHTAAKDFIVALGHYY